MATSKRLLFEPMRTPKNALLGPLAKMLGYGEAGELVNAGIDAAGTLEQWATPLSSIARVDPIGDSRLRVTLRSGESWEFGITAGLYSRGGSQGSVAAATDVITTVAQLITTQGEARPAPATAAPSATEPDPLLDGRRKAVATGQEITILADPSGFMRAVATPDGWLHFHIGETRPRPVDASLPANLVARWRLGKLEEFDEFFNLEPRGSVSGQVWLFGAIPPLQVAAGEWWWSQNASELTIGVTLPIEAGFEDMSPIAFHVVYPMRVSHIGQDLIAGKLVYGSDVEEWFLTRM